MEQRENFELDFKGNKIRVRKRTVSGRVIFGIQFFDGREDLVITRAKHADALNFWTSLPEGRQKEAEEVGPVIAAHLKEEDI
jgi:hypothetical protein